MVSVAASCPGLWHTPHNGRARPETTPYGVCKKRRRARGPPDREGPFGSSRKDIPQERSLAEDGGGCDAHHIRLMVQGQHRPCGLLSESAPCLWIPVRPQSDVPDAEMVISRNIARAASQRTTE